MENKLDALIASVKSMEKNMATKSDLAAVQHDVAETKEIVEAWKSVKLWAQFGKWVAGLVAAIVTSAAAWKAWLK